MNDRRNQSNVFQRCKESFPANSSFFGCLYCHLDTKHIAQCWEKICFFTLKDQFSGFVW